MSSRTASIGITLAVALGGCAGNGDGLDQNGRPIDGDGNGTPLTADFQSIQDHVFTPICAACHAGAAAPLGLRLDEGASFAMLVNAPSVEVAALARVTPGNPDASYLIAKLEGTAAVGERMPLGGPALPQSDIDIIREWIRAGAQPTAAAAASAKPVVLNAVTPLPDEVVAPGDLVLLVSASGELDTSLLTGNAVTLIRSGGDGRFDDGNDIAIDTLAVEVRSLAPTVFAVHVPGAQVAIDHYRLVVAGSGPAPLADRDARVIDGDADGRAGGDFQLEFDVEAQP
jgi:hypothetical protein